MKTGLIRGCLLGASVLLGLVGCGAAEPTATPPLTPTLIPTYQFLPPTVPPQVATAAASAAATMTARSSSQTLDPQRVQSGKERYEALECGKCHGANGEGTVDGATLIRITLDEEDFISFLRSGGDIGSEHQYSTNRLSDSGGRNLYQYLLSLGAPPQNQ